MIFLSSSSIFFCRCVGGRDRSRYTPSLGNESDEGPVACDVLDLLSSLRMGLNGRQQDRRENRNQNRTTRHKRRPCWEGNQKFIMPFAPAPFFLESMCVGFVHHCLSKRYRRVGSMCDVVKTNGKWYVQRVRRSHHLVSSHEDRPLSLYPRLCNRLLEAVRLRSAFLLDT